ncbi:hypothetical protein BG74_09595 [Sodalis-like endosymbiont of Proechinophthirus fluctus]|nr:hypothetical protein BG74_09595 [Sodalis-like endosymbiont of Proechinophthirus fluctus]
MVQTLQSLVAAVVRGENIGQTIEGRERFPINVRYLARAVEFGTKNARSACYYPGRCTGYTRRI